MSTSEHDMPVMMNTGMPECRERKYACTPVRLTPAACAASNIAAPGISARPNTRCAHRKDSPAVFARRQVNPAAH